MESNKCFAFLAFLFMSVCSGQVNEDVNEENIKANGTSNRIGQFLGEDDFQLLDSILTITEFEIVPKFLPEEKEYSKELKHKSEWDSTRIKTLVGHVQNDSTYDWHIDEKIENPMFSPNIHLVLKSRARQLTLLIDKVNNRLGFKDINDLRIVSINENFLSFLEREE